MELNINDLIEKIIKLNEEHLILIRENKELKDQIHHLNFITKACEHELYTAKNEVNEKLINYGKLIEEVSNLRVERSELLNKIRQLEKNSTNNTEVITETKPKRVIK